MVQFAGCFKFLKLGEIFKLLFRFIGPFQLTVMAAEEPDRAVFIHRPDLDPVTPAQLAVIGEKDNAGRIRLRGCISNSGKYHSRYQDKNK